MTDHSENCVSCAIKLYNYQYTFIAYQCIHPSVFIYYNIRLVFHPVLKSHHYKVEGNLTEPGKPCRGNPFITEDRKYLYIIKILKNVILDMLLILKGVAWFLFVPSYCMKYIKKCYQRQCQCHDLAGFIYDWWSNYSARNILL